MTLDEIAEKLRTGELTIENDLSTFSGFVPDSVLHYFAVDCADRALERIQVLRLLDAGSKAILKTTKMWKKESEEALFL
jgi:hypothetical protein